MEFSILVSKIIGVIYLSLGVGILLNGNYYKKEFVNLLKNSAYLILGGFMAIILGFIILDNHFVWVENWTVIITIIGWVALIKGIILIAFPKSVKIYKNLFSSDNFIKLLGPLVVIFGLVFTYLGFFYS